MVIGQSGRDHSSKAHSDLHRLLLTRQKGHLALQQAFWRVLDSCWAVMIGPVVCRKSRCVYASVWAYVPIYFSLFLCMFVFIRVWIPTTQKLQKHTLAQIHKASQISSDHLGQNF